MDKASLLTARMELGVSGKPHSDLVRLLGPVLEIVLRFQSLTLFLSLRAYFVASVACISIIHATNVLAWNALYVAKLGAFHGATLSRKATLGIWRSRNVQALRKKLFYEFAVFILGGGNLLFILIFWPGWWLVAGASWGLWWFFG